MDSALLHKLMGAMMLQGDEELPYVEIDYCKSDGQQYVDLGFQATVINEEVEYVYEPLSDGVNTGIPVGSELSGANGVFPVVLYSNTEGVYVGTGSKYADLNLTANQFYKITSKTNEDNTFTLSVDDEVRVSGSFTGSPNGRNVYAFSSNNGFWTKYKGFFKIKYITRKVEGVLKNKLISVRMIKDAGGGKIGDIGYWDKVNNTFHGSGSGVPLIAGPLKLVPVEYIKIAPGQAINLKVKPTNLTGLKVRSRTDRTTGVNFLAGSLSVTNVAFYLPFATDIQPYRAAFGSYVTLNNMSPIFGEFYTSSVNFENNRQVLVNDVVLYNGLPEKNLTGSIELFVGANNFRGSIYSSYYVGDVSDIWLSEGENVIKRVYAARDSQGKGYMVDEKTGEIYDDFEGGIFEVGPDKE